MFFYIPHFIFIYSLYIPLSPVYNIYVDVRASSGANDGREEGVGDALAKDEVGSSVVVPDFIFREGVGGCIAHAPVVVDGLVLAAEVEDVLKVGERVVGAFLSRLLLVCVRIIITSVFRTRHRIVLVVVAIFGMRDGAVQVVLPDDLYEVLYASILLCDDALVGAYLCLEVADVFPVGLARGGAGYLVGIAPPCLGAVHDAGFRGQFIRRVLDYVRITELLAPASAPGGEAVESWARPQIAITIAITMSQFMYHNWSGPEFIFMYLI